MKKIFALMMTAVTMMVFGLSAVFAYTYVAFTNSEEFSEYYYSDHSEWDASQKALFEEATADCTAKQKKNMVLILVCGDNGGVIKNHILVCHHPNDPEAYSIIVFDDNFNIIVNRLVYTSPKADPVQVGLNFIKSEVTHIFDIDKQKVIFESYENVKE